MITLGTALWLGARWCRGGAGQSWRESGERDHEKSEVRVEQAEDDWQASP